MRSTACAEAEIDHRLDLLQRIPDDVHLMDVPPIGQ
jgi:hypothetical protein